jgi:hypothetical protein
MKYTVEKGSGTMIYISGFIKFGSYSYIRKLIGKNTQTHRHRHKKLLSFFKTRKVGKNYSRKAGCTNWVIRFRAS